MTLVTCTPYGINTHRLLVRGARISYEMASEMAEEQIAEEVTPNSTWEEEYRRGVLIGMLGIAFIVTLVAAAKSVAQQRRIKAASRPIPKHMSQNTPLRHSNGRRGRHEAH